MKNMKMDYKKLLAILFLGFIIVTGALTVVLNPIEIFGGLARGYLDSSEEEGFLKKIGNGFSVFNDRVNEFYVLHDVAIHAYGGLQECLGRSLIDDVDPEYQVVKLKNDYLMFQQTGKASYDALSEYLVELNGVCKNNGTDFLYVHQLSKTTTDEALLPDYYPYAYGDDYETLEKKMIAGGVHFLDLNDVVEKEQIDKYSLFFKSDHHWLPSTGLQVSQWISRKINDLFDFGLRDDLLDLSNYNVDLYPAGFLGSQGSRVGRLYSIVDDFEIVTPKYDTNLLMEIASKNISAKGSFEEVLIHREHITPDDLLNMKGTAYKAYMEGNHDLVTIQNENLPEGKTCLLVMDSMGCVVAPYLSQMFHRIDCIDTRHFSVPLDEYIAQTKPDVVVYMVKWIQVID